MARARLIGMHDEIGEPGMVAPLSDAAQIRSHPVAHTDRVTPVAEACVDQLDVLRLASEKQPAWAGVECLGELLETLRHVAYRIDRHRDEEDVASDHVAERVLDLRDARRGERAHV